MRATTAATCSNVKRRPATRASSSDPPVMSRIASHSTPSFSPAS
jgi:hypothetical protein